MHQCIYMSKLLYVKAPVCRCIYTSIFQIHLWIHMSLHPYINIFFYAYVCIFVICLYFYVSVHSYVCILMYYLIYQPINMLMYLFTYQYNGSIYTYIHLIHICIHPNPRESKSIDLPNPRESSRQTGIQGKAKSNGKRDLRQTGIQGKADV